MKISLILPFSYSGGLPGIIGLASSCPYKTPPWSKKTVKQRIPTAILAMTFLFLRDIWRSAWHFTASSCLSLSFRLALPSVSCAKAVISSHFDQGFVNVPTGTQPTLTGHPSSCCSSSPARCPLQICPDRQKSAQKQCKRAQLT